jgi:hypothetical protein
MRVVGRVCRRGSFHKRDLSAGSRGVLRHEELLWHLATPVYAVFLLWELGGAAWVLGDWPIGGHISR